MAIYRRPTPTNADRTTQAKGVSRFAGKKYQPQTHTETHRRRGVAASRENKNYKYEEEAFHQQ